MPSFFIPFFSNILAPGYVSGPFCNNFVRNFLFLEFTTAGKVIVIATFIGIPSSLIFNVASGEITDLAV